MIYQNPKIPEGINTSTSHPLREFAIVVGSIVVIVVVAVTILAWAAGWLVPRIPFSTEQRIADSFVSQLVDEPGDPKVQSWLQAMADRLAPAEGLPPSMPITVHYSDSDTVNAFATLGGHILFYRGLLETLSSENAVAMVMAHEIAHVKHRDPVVAMGRGITVAVALAAISGSVGDKLANSIIGNAAFLTSLRFNREQETDADDEGLAAVDKVYGHVEGATDLFSNLVKEGGDHSLMMPEFTRTHPDLKKRIRRIQHTAADHDWNLYGDLTPLPDFIPQRKAE